MDELIRTSGLMDEWMYKYNTNTDQIYNARKVTPKCESEAYG